MPEITSPQNPHIKEVVRLRERRQRDRTGMMLVEGSYELTLALESGIQPREIYCCQELAMGHPKPRLKVDPIFVSRAVFEKISYRDRPDGWSGILLQALFYQFTLSPGLYGRWEEPKII